MVHLTIHDTDIFDAEGLRRALGLRRRSVALAIRSGRLIGHKAAGRWWFCGKAVRAWLLGESTAWFPAAGRGETERDRRARGRAG
jgi:hypothetical protein